MDIIDSQLNWALCEFALLYFHTNDFWNIVKRFPFIFCWHMKWYLLVKIHAPRSSAPKVEGCPTNVQKLTSSSFSLFYFPCFITAIKSNYFYRSYILEYHVFSTPLHFLFPQTFYISCCSVIFGCQDARPQKPSGGETFDGKANFKCRGRNRHLLTFVWR